MGKVKNLLPEDIELEDDMPRGAGDPDVYGYPGEPKVKGVTPNVDTTRPIDLTNVPF